MFNYVANLGSTFLLGLLTPLTAVCVLPLYPGFLTFLSGRITSEGINSNRIISAGTGPKSLLPLGLIVTSGVISFMLILGVVFTTLLEISLTMIVGIISPAAFALLTALSLILILNVDISRFIPRLKAPEARSPLMKAFLFGFFFGTIVAPCNPGLVAAFFTKTIATTTVSFLSNFFHFIIFGVGIGFPLLLFSALSQTRSQMIIRFLGRHKTIINRAAGGIMLTVSLYYLIFVFQLFS
jgi:cytochrome c-type biogenesis protein